MSDETIAKVFVVALLLMMILPAGIMIQGFREQQRWLEKVRREQAERRERCGLCRRHLRTEPLA